LVLILFAISVACFLALIGTVTAIVRYVCASHARKRIVALPKPSFSEHIHAAVKYGTVRSPRLVPHQTVQGIAAKKSWNSSSVEKLGAEQTSVIGKRKSPQPAHAPERANWAHFNQDSGDLIDHYTRAAAAKSARSKRL
jgi:hypothetical protein